MSLSRQLETPVNPSDGPTPVVLRAAGAEIETRDLPEPRPFRSVIGPGVILVATAVGSGEILFWPGIVSSYGFQFFWLAIAAVAAQYVLNTEFARYTLATGEPVTRGFSRLWSGFSWFFLAAAILPWVWPGWATGGAAALSWVFGGNVAHIASATLVAIGLLLTSARVVYRAVEITQTVLIGAILVVAIGVALLTVREPTLTAAASGLLAAPFPFPADLATTTLLSAIVFCGAGGTINLAISHWVRDKGLGMGVYAKRIVSPFSGENIAVGAQGFRFEPTRENNQRWSAWWRLVRREQQLTFVAIGTACLLLFMLIAHAVSNGSGGGVDMNAVRAQAERLGSTFGPTMFTVFALMVAAIFIKSSLGVLDHAARLAANILKTSVALFARSKERWSSESGLYFITLWCMIAFGVFVLLGLEVADPPALLIIAGSLSGIVMFVYSVLAIALNVAMKRRLNAEDARFAAANPFTVNWPRWTMMAVAVALYGGLSIAVIIDALNKALG